MDDMISRLATLEALLDKGQRSRRYKLGDIWELNFDEIREVINALPPEPRWIPCSERLPEENVYVLVWCGEIKIARIVYGISKEQRAKMQEGAIDDPVTWGWNLSNGYFEVKRSESYRPCDEYCNNKVPYCWDCIYGEMFGQDVIAWMPLPEPYRKEDMEDNNLYDVELTYSADGMTTGHVHITKEQYEFLKWVADPNNWKNLEKEPYSGDLCVYCEELENSK